MKTKLTLLLALGLSLVASLCILDVATSNSAAVPINKSATIRLNIIQMLQRKIPIQPLPDIPGAGHARTATNRDAAYFAWQEFIALNWANVPVTGKANSVGQSGARETADTSKKFGQPPTGAPGTSYPALVWESTRHRAEIFTPQPIPAINPAPTPHGYTPNASSSWGYNSTPGYVYPGLTVTPSGSPSALAPFVNLDEGSQIGTCQMFWKGREVLFMAKANYQEYGYVASRGWYNLDLLANPPASPSPVASYASTSGYIVTQGEFPPAGNVDGSQNPGAYVSLPNGTLEFKAAFRIATAAERTAYESGLPIPGGFHAAPIRYYKSGSKPNQFAYVDTVGVLLSLHIIHKTPSAPYFIFATFEHKDDILGTDGRPVEDAEGRRNANAFTTAKPSPLPANYVYPSSGTTPPGKYLVDATTPNVLEFPSQSQSGNVTYQQFIPAPNDNGVAKSTTQSSYQNTRNARPTPTPTPLPAVLEASNSPSVTESYLTVNRRRFSIPNTIIAVNQDVHNLIKMYGYAGGTSGIATSNVWLNYKLVNVQWIPAGNASQKTAGKLYGGASIPVESYYLSNSLVETNMVLSAFSGQFNFNFGYGLSITDFYYTDTNYTDPNTGKSTTKSTGAPFYNIYTKGGPYNMGGCMGCHGNTTVNGGSDASFILGHGKPFVIDGINPPPVLMQERFRRYFRKD